jgi:hypothetical protein
MGVELSSILILLASCQQTCMTYTTAVCTVKNSWWWTEKLSKICRVSFQEYIWEINASSWFYYKKFNTMHSHMNVKKNTDIRNSSWKTASGLVNMKPYKNRTFITIFTMFTTPNIPILFTAIPHHIKISPFQCTGYTALLKTFHNHFWWDVLSCPYDPHWLHTTFIFLDL